MTSSYPASGLGSSGAYTIAGVASYWGALNSDQTTYLRLFSGSEASFAFDLGLPSELSDEYEWCEAEMRCAVQAPNIGETAVADLAPAGAWSYSTVPVTPNGWFRQTGTTWSDVVSGLSDMTGHTNIVLGPREMFRQAWTLRIYGAPTASALTWANDCRLVVGRTWQAPVASILGPVGVLEIIGNLLVTWTPSVVSSEPAYYDGARVSISTSPGGIGVIWSTVTPSNTASPATSVTVPGSFLADYIGQQLYVQVQASQIVETWPSPYNYRHVIFGSSGLRQFGAPAEATFTPIGTVVGGYAATDPGDTVTALSAPARARLAFVNTPAIRAFIYSYDGQQRWELDVLDGEVDIDGRRQVRSTCRLVVANTELWSAPIYPLDPTRPLNPETGSYLNLARGIGDELVALGSFRIMDSELDETIAGRSRIIVYGDDFARLLKSSRFTYDRHRQTFPAGVQTPDDVLEVIDDIVREAGLRPGGSGTNMSKVAGNYVNVIAQDRADVLDSLCGSIDFWWYANDVGEIIREPLPSATATPRYSLREGADCVIISQTTHKSARDLRDLAVAYDPDGLFVRGAADSNIASPIYRSGHNPASPTVGAGRLAPGGVPTFFASPTITAAATANASARTVLSHQGVPAARLVIATGVIPDLRPGHVITVHRAGESERLWVVDAVLGIPLTPEVARVTIEAHSPLTFITPASD